MTEEPERHRVGPTPGWLLAIYGSVGVVAGWLVRYASLRFGTTEPRVSWLAIGIVAFLAAGVAALAAHTSRLRREGRRLQPHRAVNRLVLGKTCALVGALAAGGYLGFAIAHLGIDGGSAHTQLIRSAIAAVLALGILAASLWLEHACRVQGDDD